MTDKFQWKRGSYQNPLYIFYQDESGAFSPENFQYSTGTVQRPAFVITLDGSGNQIFPVPEAPSDSVTYGRKNGAWVSLDNGLDGTFSDADFTLTKEADATAKAMFTVGSATATTSNFTLPATSATLAHIGTDPQTFAGVITSTAGVNASNANLSITRTDATANMSIQGDGQAAQFDLRRYSNDTGSPSGVFRKARGSIAVPAVIASGDQIANLTFQAHNGTSFSTPATLIVVVNETTPSSTAMASYFRFNTAPVGSATPTDTVRIGASLGLQMFGSNTVFDTSRLLQNRVFTLGTLATGAAGKQSYPSDLGGGANLIVHDGTNYKRAGNGGYATVSTNADFTLTSLTSAVNIRHTGTLTADRTITLATASTAAGAEFLVTRTGSGAFNLSVGGLKNLVQNTWAMVIFDGSAWYLAAYGAL